MAESQNPKAEWWTTVPQPKSKCPGISGDELMKMFDDMDIKPGPRQFLLVDVRRNDWEGGTIMSSLNLPAQSFYQTRKTLLDLCDRASIKQVIFYCGSSAGRGTRCAGWMQDYIDDIAKVGRKTDLKVLVLVGGIKKWVKDFEGSMVENFEEKYWEQFE